MVTIVLGVGSTRGWRSTILGAAAGFAVLAVAVVVLGVALTALPIGPLRVLVGTLLLLFGLQWYRKGIARVAAHVLGGVHVVDPEEDAPAHSGVDWTAFVLSFKGVLLEGLEVAFIVVTFGVTAGHLGSAIAAGVAAVVLLGVIGIAVRGQVQRMPRSLLQLIVGTMLTTFGTFWALEGLGVDWPHGDLDIVVLFVLYSLTALVYIWMRRSVHFTRMGATGGNDLAAPAGANGFVRFAVNVANFVYGFIVGDDWTVAAVMAAGLVVTAVLVANHLPAWWLVPLLAIVTTGISLARHPAFRATPAPSPS